MVLDASAVVELLLGTATGRRVAERISPQAVSLHTPHVLDLEVAQVIRRYASSRALTPEQGKQALRDLVALDLARYAHDILLPRIWQLRKNATAYDAAYLALAEVLSAPLLTCDRKLTSVPGCRVQVELA